MPQMKQDTGISEEQGIGKKPSKIAPPTRGDMPKNPQDSRIYTKEKQKPIQKPRPQNNIPSRKGNIGNTPMSFPEAEIYG